MMSQAINLLCVVLSGRMSVEAPCRTDFQNRVQRILEAKVDMKYSPIYALQTEYFRPLRQNLSQDIGHNDEPFIYLRS